MPSAPDLDRRQLASADSARPPTATVVADVHCHCLPGIDDGPGTAADALDLCRALLADGVTHAIATPHQLGRYDRQNPAAKIRTAVAALQQSLAEQRIPLHVLPGADVRVDERILQLLDADEVMTLADRRRHVLLELPHDSYIEPLQLILTLVRRGLQPIVSHPERHPSVARKPALVLPWLDNGAILQVTAGSLLGDFGATAETAGWKLVGAGVVALIATDAHGTRTRPPRMSRAADELRRRVGAAAARAMCVENPRRVLQGEPCKPCVEVRAAAGHRVDVTGRTA